MKHNPIRILFILLFLTFVILDCKKEHSLKPNAKVVQIPSLGLGLDYEGWNFNDNPNLMNQTEKIASDTDNSGTIKKALEFVGINFFLFEYPQGSTEAGLFNTNINYTIEDLSKQPREISLDDYISTMTGLYPVVLQKYEMINPPKKSKIHGIDSVLLESRFEQPVGGKNLKIHNYQRIFIVNQKAHVFTGSFLEKEAGSKGPKVLEVLGKFVKL
ncbi:hypothetical protein LEP1GSC060_3288 [Leptospira weilii serovar Ranarum str. ICFT]|uniref:Lipoprotein n=1 Tax=Leptospira weilii serovar Ranarum str. ICFT TaxID=1218598 RepID=N1W974_9LEPT|nr:hypothetical protein [Leptospira weilii]EMY76781.1 hypothetical protein LEP1GSC060_3288 [Leptospira weilii serovar Ranarum str. ICFT]